jgi:hypothetical protein
MAQNVPGIANFDSNNIGYPFDAVITMAPLVPLGGGGVTTFPGQQIINIDFMTSGVVFMRGGYALTMTTPFAGPLSVNFISSGFPVTLSAQMVILDPVHVDSFSLSQGCQLVVL